MDLKWEEYSPHSKQAYIEELKKHVYLLKEKNLSLKECVPHCFPMRIESANERNPCYLSVFACGRIIHFMKNITSDIMEKQKHLLQQYNMCKIQDCFACSFSVSIDLEFERNAYLSWFSNVRNIGLVQNRLIQMN
jgi:hypothetical protein